MPISGPRLRRAFIVPMLPEQVVKMSRPASRANSWADGMEPSRYAVNSASRKLSSSGMWCRPFERGRHFTGLQPPHVEIKVAVQYPPLLVTVDQAECKGVTQAAAQQFTQLQGGRPAQRPATLTVATAEAAASDVEPVQALNCAAVTERSQRRCLAGDQKHARALHRCDLLGVIRTAQTSQSAGQVLIERLTVVNLDGQGVTQFSQVVRQRIKVG